MGRIGKIRKVSKGIESYSYLMNGIAGIGKTTTVCEIGMKKFGEDGFLLMTLGAEPEPDHIGGVWNAVYKDVYEYDTISQTDKLIKTGWEQLNEDIDSIIAERNTEYKDLRMIGIDSIGELFRLAETAVVEEYNATQKPADRVKTINEAYKGYSRGQNRVVDLVTNLLIKIKDANISPFFIGHTKQKNTTDIISGTEFEQITSDVETKYYNCIKDRVNIVMCAYMDRTYSDVETKKDKFTKKDKQVGKIQDEKRIVSFKDENYAIDLKCHLTYMPDKCALDSDVIIEELEKAIDLQAKKYGGKTTTKAEVLNERKKEFEEKQEIKADETKVKEEKLEKIKGSLASLDMGKLQEIMKKYSITGFNDAQSVPMEALDEILELI